MTSEPLGTFVSLNPGRDVQRVGTAAFLGEDVRQDPRPGVGGDRQPRRQPVLPGRPGEGGGRAGRAVPPHCEGRPAGPVDTARVHPGRLGRPAQRHASDAVLPRRPGAGPRHRRRAPGGERRGRVGGRRGVRQAPRRDARRRAREQHTRGHPLRRPDQARDRPGDGSPDRPRVGLRGGRPGRRGPGPLRPQRLPGAGQLRGHVHLQHDADLHRRARPGTAAHGVPDLRRSAPDDRVPRPAGGLPGDHDGAGASVRATSSRRRRCATP